MLSFMLALAITAPSIAPVGNQSVETIVEKSVAARGGLEAWRAVRSLHMSGNMDVGRGMQVPFTLWLARPKKLRLDYVFDGQSVVQVFDGRRGWKKEPYLGRGGFEPFTPEELQAADAQVELDGPLVDYRAKGHRVALLGTQNVEGRAAFQIAVTLASGAVVDLYVDAETFLEVKRAGTRRVAGKELPFETFFRDYRRVGSVLVPHHLETRVEGAPASSSMRIERVEANAPVEDGVFAFPMAPAPPGD